MNEVASISAPEHSLSIERRWGNAVTDASGFVAVPMALLRSQADFGLNSTDMLVLINLLAHWWRPNEGVYPRTTTIAKRMNVDSRTVQRSFNKLVRTGLMEREMPENGKRSFHFDKLAKKLAAKMPRTLRMAASESLDA